jgi:tRNA pseudouridine38-40 synthase
MQCFKITLAYDGAGFSGWQRQGTLRTVQGELETVLSRIEERPVTVTGAGRTDAGVHAAGQVASVRLTKSIAADDLLRALNALLAADLRVRAVEGMPARFNARIHAKRKTYHYWIWNARLMPPLLRNTVWHVPQPLDIDAMTRAARLFEGTHDFVSLQARGARVKTTTRTMAVSRIGNVPVADWPWALPLDGAVGLLRYEASGDGFLRHMVRTMAGTIVDVGRGRRRPDDIEAILASRLRARTGQTAPPHGLVLWSVNYEIADVEIAD